MNLGQRLALGALVVGLLVVGGLDLLNRSSTTVSATGAGSPAMAGAAGAGGAAAAAPAASAAAAPPADAATVPVAAVAATPTTAASGAEEDDAGAEPDTVVVEDPPAGEALPANSGTGRRIVYTVKGHRIWVVDESNNVLRTMLVTNRKFVPNPGNYKVFGKAVKTQNKFFPEIKMNYMTRFAISPNKKNTIGFHAIPFKNGKPMQTEAQLGSYGSGGCVRLKESDAIFVFNWAAVGTKVVVLP